MPSSEPIRVMRVIARLNVGGPALHVSYLSRGLDEMGYETTLVTGRVGRGEGSMEHAARELGVRPLVIDALGREIAPQRDLAVALRLRDVIRRVRPNILHTHTAKAGAIGRLAGALAGDARPSVTVHTFHGHVLRGYFGRYSTAGFRQVERGLAATTDALIAVSPEVRDDLVELGVARASKIAVIRLGLDLDRRIAAPPDARERLRAELRIDDDAVAVAWLGRMTEIKRVRDLLDAFAALDASRTRSVLLLIGDGPLRRQLELHAARLGIGDRCRFLGYRDDVGAVYAAADVVALSSASEGTPVSLIEALAAGRPVVSTNVGGVRDVVEDGTSGFLVPARDTAAFTRGLEMVVSDRALRERFGAAGRERTSARYAVPRLLSDVDSLYRALLDEREPLVTRRLGPRDRPLKPVLAPPPRLRRRPTRRLRVVLVSQYFPPEIGATQSRIQSFAEHLSERGHRVTVVAEFPNHPHGVIPEEYRGELYRIDDSNPYRVLRVWVAASSVKTQRTRLELYLSFMGLGSLLAPVVGRADVVLATSPPLFAGVTGLVLAEVNRAPFILDVRDLWPAAALSLDQISGTAVLRAAQQLEAFLYRRAFVVTAVTRPFCDHIDAVRGRGPATVFLPNGTLELFFADHRDGARARLGLPEDAFLVTFAGTHGIAQGLPAILEGASALDGRAHFAFVGDGPVKAQLVRQAEELGLRNASFHAQLPLEEIPPILGASDALLVPLSCNETFTQFVPSKMLDYMAAGKPVLLSAAGEAARILERAEAGIVVPPENGPALAEAVSWLAAHPAEAQEMGANGRRFASQWLRSGQAERLERLLLDVVERR